MTTPSELFDHVGPVQGVKGPVQGIMTQPRMLSRAATHRRFPAGTPVRVYQPGNKWFGDSSLVIEHEGVQYLRHLCAEDCEQLEDFVTRRGRVATLKDETVFDLGMEANRYLTLQPGDKVDVYLQAGGRMWATTPDGGWDTFFVEGKAPDADPFEACVKVEASDMARLRRMKEGDLHAAPAPLDIGHPYEERTARRRKAMASSP